MRTFCILAIIATILFVVYAVTGSTHSQMSKEQRICYNWAEKLAPPGYYTTDQFMSQYRACMYRNR
jgi:hypothetical protein